MSAPIDTIDAAIAAMDREVERCVGCGDAGGYFAIIYRAVTERVRDGIAAGDFADGEQMEHFDVLFARRYLDARRAWESGSGPVPESWRLAFDTAQNRRCLVTQHLLLGINAHINLDLGVARGRGRDAPGRSGRSATTSRRSTTCSRSWSIACRIRWRGCLRGPVGSMSPVCGSMRPSSLSACAGLARTPGTSPRHSVRRRRTNVGSSKRTVTPRWRHSVPGLPGRGDR